MIVPIIEISALEYWLNGTNRYFYHTPERKTLPANFKFQVNTQKALEIAKEYQLMLPLYLMVPEKTRLNKTKTFIRKSFIKGLPYKSFVKLNDRGNSDDEVYVACPELCFLQAANIFPFYITVKIGCMLCAMYVRDDEMAMGQRNIQPLTTMKKIKQYLDKVDKAQGIVKAKRALKYISDNCNSPMEVNIAVMGKLPLSEGGYAIGDFEMNGEVKLKQEAVEFLGRKACMCDVVWEAKKVVAEYESNLVHLEKEQHEYDKRRSTAIMNAGYKIINITAKDMGLLSRADEIFLLLKKALGIRSDNQRLKKFEDVRFEVFQNVFKKDIFQILKEYNQKLNNVIY